LEAYEVGSGGGQIARTHQIVVDAEMYEGVARGFPDATRQELMLKGKHARSWLTGSPP
jgi:hypothetical protein